MLDTGDRRRGLPAGRVDHGDDARPLETGWKLCRADAAWAVNNPGPLSSKDSEGDHTSWTASSARSKSPRSRMRMATACPNSSRKTCSMTWRVVPATLTLLLPTRRGTP